MDIRENHIKVSASINLANYYAVEILTEIFGIIDPKQSDIDKIVEKMESKPARLKNFENIASKKVLIISSNPIEQNSLLMMLTSLNMEVSLISTKKELLAYFAKPQSHNVIFISDLFKEIKLKEIIEAFTNMPHDPYLVYLNSQRKKYGASLSKIDFILDHPFLFNDVKKVLFYLFGN